MWEEIVPVIIGVPAVVLALIMILRFKLKQKELEMRGSDVGTDGRCAA